MCLLPVTTLQAQKVENRPVHVGYTTVKRLCTLCTSQSYFIAQLSKLQLDPTLILTRSVTPKETSNCMTRTHRPLVCTATAVDGESPTHNTVSDMSIRSILLFSLALKSASSLRVLSRRLAIIYAHSSATTTPYKIAVAYDIFDSRREGSQVLQLGSLLHNAYCIHMPMI